MANFKTDIAWSPNSGVQRQSEEVSGIMGTAPEDTQAEEQGFFERMMERLYDNFYDKDDAVDFFDEPSPVATTVLPGSDWDTLEPVDELLRDYQEGNAPIETIMPPMGQEPDSLAPSTSIRPKEKGSILARGMSPRPQARPVEEEEEQEVAAVEEETTTSTGAGLMSPDNSVSAEELPFSFGISDTEDARSVLRESQQRLKDAGYYRTRVDGVGGRSTSNAVKTFQYDAGLEPTGELDEETRLKLAETDLDSRPEISDAGDELLNFIGKGESGGYGAANNYNSTAGRTEWGVMDSYFSERYQKPIDKLTIREIQDIQEGGYGNREVFAVGAFQMIPDTLDAAVQALGLTGDEVFDAELQNRIAVEYLAGSKRPDLRDYLRGEEGVTRDEALLAFAKEWASVPVPYDIPRKGMLIRRGESYWKPEGNTADAHTAEEAEQLLDDLRAEAIARRGD